MDWPKLIQELCDCGLTQAEIGRRVGRAQTWVSAVANGKYKDLGYTDGKRLLEVRDNLHRRRAKAGAEA